MSTQRLFGRLNTVPRPTDNDTAANEATRTGSPVTELGECRAPFALRSGGLLIGLSGAPIWRGENLTSENTERILSQVARTYRERDEMVLSALEGAFALAILDPEKQRALLAVDRMGVEPLAYALLGGGLVFGSSVADIALCSERGRSPRRQAIFDFLFLHMVPAPHTIYEGVMKLPIATALRLESGHVDLHRYWEPEYNYAGSGDFDGLKASLRSALQAGVHASDPSDATGAFLSGGLDSSSVAGTLRSIAQSPIPTFTIGFGDSEHDEIRFARIANRHFGNRAHEYQMRPADVLDAFPRIVAAYDEPFGNPSALPTYFCAKLAAENGVVHVLAGDGGDELFGGNERYVRHWVFELYQRLPRPLRRRCLEPLTRSIAQDSRLIPLRKIRSYVDQAQIPLPDRFESWNYMYRERGGQMLDPEFAEFIDPEGPLVHLRNLWDEAPSSNLLERMLWYDWQHTLADNDLRKVTVMTSLAGVRVSFPMLHPAVVELSTRIPPEMKIEGKMLRSFFKRAMADFLPSEIIHKQKHGFALPFGTWIKENQLLRDLIYSHVSDLKKRRIIRPAFLDNLIEQHRTGDPYYYGYAIWDLAVLQAWMAHYIDKS